MAMNALNHAWPASQATFRVSKVLGLHLLGVKKSVELGEDTNFFYKLHCVLDQVAPPDDRNPPISCVSDSRAPGPPASPAGRSSPVIWPFLKEDAPECFCIQCAEWNPQRVESHELMSLDFHILFLTPTVQPWARQPFSISFLTCKMMLLTKEN